VHGAFVSDDEVLRIVAYLKEHGEPEYIDEILNPPAEDEDGNGEGGSLEQDAEADPLYDRAVALVLKSRRPTISWVQRNLSIGYNRAARMIEQMERAGLVSPMGNNGMREVLAPKPQSDDE
jgi:S-DNA-T family DNA segregation ATPase FtsK/SpoIIIE